MKYGLKNKQITAIREVFKKHPEIEEAVLYGSRAKGNFLTGSDIDLSLKGDGLNLSLLFKIERQIDDLLLPYYVDLSLFDRIENLNLIDHIQRCGKIFYDKS